ncbi:MAG: DUF3006 domain-containing protein [Thermoleophilia bacterium]
MKSDIDCYLDRFEGISAVLLIDAIEIIVPASILPQDTREGDHLSLSISINSAARELTASETSELQKKMKLQQEDNQA